MTFKAEHDTKFTLQFAFVTVCAAVTLYGGLFMGNILALFIAIPLTLTAAVSGMQLYKTAYTLGDSLLEAKSGISRVVVEYKDITLVTDQKDTPADGYVPLATSARKLYVVYTQDGKSYRMELSPRDREGFIKALGEKL